MALIVPADFYLRYPQITGTTENAVVTELIADADALLAAYAGFPENDAGIHTFASSTYTIFLDRPSFVESTVLCLCVHPIVSITSLHVSADRVYDGTTLVPALDYSFDSREGMLILSPSSTYSFTTAFRSIRLVAVAGYATTPPGLRAIACATVRHLWNLRQVQGQSSYGLGGDSATLTDTEALLPAAVKDALRSAYMTRCAVALLEAA